jgi:Mg-chelatase subunit ChlD
MSKECNKCGHDNQDEAKYCNQCGSLLGNVEEQDIIYNLIILDESGSMSSIRRQAINGFNETVQTIKDAQREYPEQRHFVSLVSFNSSRTNILYDKAEAEKVAELSEATYIPNAGTPLYDAMGIALTNLKQSVKSGDKVLVTVITDGEENASREYTGAAIKKLVDECKLQGWVFTYIGANQDVEKVAATISITNVLEFKPTVQGSVEMYEKDKKARQRYYKKVADKDPSQASQSDFFDEEKT